MNRFITCSILAFIYFLASCTIKTPEVTFTSERTALERQILGSYRTIEEDAWMVSSVRSSSPQEVQIPGSKRLVLEAFANRKFNADDIEDFKRDGVIGEMLTGLLILRPTQKYEKDAAYSALVDRIMAEENRDRNIIMDRVVEINSSVNPTDREAVRRIFAQMSRAASPPGSWIQLEDKRWVKK